MPLSISGKALGNTISHNTRARLAPRLRADQISTSSVPRAPLNAESVTGSRHPTKISTTFDASPKPSHSTMTGISADFGIG